jgi:hypothetical protein
MRLWPFGRKRRKKKTADQPKPHVEWETEPPVEIPARYEDSLAAFRRQFQYADDFVARQISLGEPPGTHAALLFIQGLANKEQLSEEIMESSMLLGRIADPHVIGEGARLIDLLESRYIAFAAVSRETQFTEAVIAILKGETVLILDGASEVLVFDTKGWEKRGVEEPVTEAVIRGPRDGFIETMRTNVVQIRRRLRTPDLAVKSLRIGRRSQTDVTIMYMADVAEPELVGELQRRLMDLDVDGILESGQLESLISDSPVSVFPLIERTERPDKVAASILEGRVAIVTDNTPFVLLVPAVAWTFFQASEDYYENFYLATALRFLRIVAFFTATFATAIYVAAVSYHHELIPFSLLLRVVGTHEGIPFHTIPTALIMETVIEVLREAGVRLPRPVGQAVSIVGAIIIGEAAVSAGFAPPGMVIVVAFSAISSFAVPGYNMAVAFRLLRFPMILAAGAMGLFGLGTMAMIFLIHLCSLRSFGYPYFGPLDTRRLSELRDKPLALPIQYRSPRRPVWGRRDTYRQGELEGSPPVPRKTRPAGKREDGNGGARPRDE